MLVVFDMCWRMPAAILWWTALSGSGAGSSKPSRPEELAGRAGFLLSPATTDARTARAWLDATGSTFDGVVAKRLDLEYRSGDRTGMQKVKRLRTVDCVVGGFR